MKYFLLFLLAFVSLASARTPIDTVAWERSDSGSKYIKIHAELPKEQRLYARYGVFSMDSGVATELFDSTKGSGSVYIPVATSTTKYVLTFSAFATEAITWAGVLKLDTNTLLSASSSSKFQIRDLELYADTAADKIYIKRTVFVDSAVSTVLDSASFTRWLVPNKLSWRITPSKAAKLLSVRSAVQH